MGRIVYPKTRESERVDIRARLQALETNMSQPFSGRGISSQNGAVINQPVPSVGNFDGVTRFEVAMAAACTFRLMAPTRLLIRSATTLKLAAPGGGQFARWTTAISPQPWNPATIVVESGETRLDAATLGYLNLGIWLSPDAGANLTPAITLGAGYYEVRQRLIGDVGTQCAYYQGSIQVFATGG